MCDRIQKTFFLCIVTVICSGCGLISIKTTPSHLPKLVNTPVPTATPTPGVTPLHGTRTVLSPIGLNMHQSPATTAPLVGILSQGSTLTVMRYTAASGGWYEVQGATTTGWIVADNSLSANGTLVNYGPDANGITALYPQNWAPSQEQNEIVFSPNQGNGAIIVRIAASEAALTTLDTGNYVSTSESAVEVCGITGTLMQFQALAVGTSQSPTPSSALAMQFDLPLRQEILLKVAATTSIEFQYNYQKQQGTTLFQNFYNSASFPYPGCSGPSRPTPSP